jgi:endonuclease YncB( thermonuclease family)
VASEAAGCSHVSGPISVEFVSGYDAYVASIRRLLSLEVEVLAQGHANVYTGQDASDFLRRSLEETERYRCWVEDLLAQEQGDVDRVVKRLRDVQWLPLPLPKQRESAFLLNTEARVRHLASRITG